MYLKNEKKFNSKTKRFTKLHFLKCDLCAIEFHPKMKESEAALKKKLNFCGKSCQTEATKKGGSIDKKYKKTCLKLYGTESPNSLKEFQEKRKQACLEKHGYENYFQSPEFFKKQKETNIKNFGVEFAAQADINKEKQKQTYIKNYGVSSPLKDKTILQKKNQTMFERFGVEHSLQNKELLDKRAATCLERYGVEHYAQTKEFMDNYKCSSYFDQGHDFFLGKKFYYRSSYEKRFIDKLKQFEHQFIEFEPNIKFEYQFQNKTHYYFVDFYLKTIERIKFLVEIKGEFLMEKEQTEAKINHVKSVYKKYDYDFYLLLKLKEIEKLENIKIWGNFLQSLKDNVAK